MVEEVRPPTTASASGWFASEPRSSPSAVGIKPITVARLVMAMGTKRGRQKQEELFYASELAETPGHPFYEQLNRVLEEAKFDGFCDEVSVVEVEAFSTLWLCDAVLARKFPSPEYAAVIVRLPEVA